MKPKRYAIKLHLYFEQTKNAKPLRKGGIAGHLSKTGNWYENRKTLKVNWNICHRDWKIKGTARHINLKNKSKTIYQWNTNKLHKCKCDKD